MVDGRIQSFPWAHWRKEFPLADASGFRLMEWTLDQERLYENPLMTEAGQDDIRALCKRHRLSIPSLTGDCFMQAPFWKASEAESTALKRDFISIAEACAAVGISIMVVPLVDNGSVESSGHTDALVEFFMANREFLADRNLKIAFESDFAAAELARFIARFDPVRVGINYDIGNSAGMGFDVSEEIAAYGDRIINVHIKDRIKGGTTVPLGTGNADFAAAFTALRRVNYEGNYILQTARAADGDHAGVLSRFRDQSYEWIMSRAA